jgi:hypothetical protein
MNSTPYDSTNSTNPWLMKCSGPALKDDTGNALTAEYIWSKCGVEREALVEWVFGHYRTEGYPVFKLSAAELQADYDALKAKDASEVWDGACIKNSNTVGLDAAKHFTADLFLAAKGSGKSKSCLEVFGDDELFKKVLKNRMGWCTSKEDGTVRPYVFGINDKMITQGMRSSGLGYSVSHFKPLIAKYVFQKYDVGSVLDYSCGWGARCVAALSAGVSYYGIDPLTSDRVNDIIAYFGGTGFSVKSGSEVLDYSVFPAVDMCFSSPPYFDLEVYSMDPAQSSSYGYSDWLKLYWEETVRRCSAKCKWFSFVAVERVGKHDLLNDMRVVCEGLGLKLVEDLAIKTARGHLSGKVKSGVTSKATEHVLVFEV